VSFYDKQSWARWQDGEQFRAPLFGQDAQDGEGVQEELTELDNFSQHGETGENGMFPLTAEKVMCLTSSRD